MGLLRRLKNPFDLPLALAVTPGPQQVPNRVKLQHVLELHGILALQHPIQRNVENRMRRPATMLSR